MATLEQIPVTPPTRRSTQESILAAVRQLQGLKQVVVAGAAADTNIAIAGISTADVLVGVIEVPANGAMVNRTSTTSITSAGNIQCTAATTSNQLLVTYFDVAP